MTTNKPEARLYETLAGMAKGRPLKMIERLCENQKTVSCARLATMIEEAQDLNREYAVAIRYSHEAASAADKARIAELQSALEDARYRITQPKIWNGTAFEYTGIHRRQQAKIVALIDAALNKEPSQ